MTSTRPRLMAYLDRWSALAGEHVEVHCSGGHGVASVDVVDLVTGRDECLMPPRSVRIRPQPVPAGSYLDVAAISVPVSGNLAMWLRPAVVGQRAALAEIRAGAWNLLLGSHDDGSVILGRRGDASYARAPHVLAPDQWILLLAGWRAGEDGTRFDLLAARVDGMRVRSVAHAGGGLDVSAVGSLRLAAGYEGEPTYRGRIALPNLAATVTDDERLSALLSTATGAALASQLGENAVAVWDFAVDPGGVLVRDLTRHGFDARAVNRPLGGLLGPLRVPVGSRTAARFSPDDLDDARWPVVCTVQIPDDTGPTVAAVRVRAAGETISVPVVVRPRHPRRQAPSIAVVLPTYTYLAYANHRQVSEAAYITDYSRVTERPVELSDIDLYLNAHPELGPSLYDRSPGDTATYYSSRLRPILNYSPDYRWWMTGAPRHFPADLLLLRWLRTQGIAVDVLTDDDAHHGGIECLDRYRVVVTGSHPEYVTSRQHDAISQFVDRGGRLVYLGGNGFYWVTGVDDRYPHAIEVRRRSRDGWWDNEPDEHYLTSTGEPGGLWRDRGRPPQALLGVGFTAQGWGRACAYRRLPDSFRDDAAWVFAGVDEDPIGAYGLALHGAAGDEIDRADVELGTPPETLVLATSAGAHSRHYETAPEEAGAPVRADMTLRWAERGGAVFAVGSINWITSLAHQGGDNGVARITRNVLERFAKTDD